nr:MAG TPA: hypothetical protein [Ackermannviridae sp.]
MAIFLHFPIYVILICSRFEAFLPAGTLKFPKLAPASIITLTIKSYFYHILYCVI